MQGINDSMSEEDSLATLKRMLHSLS